MQKSPILNCLKEENFYLVGDSAVQAKVQTSVKQLKSESLIPKVLGIIGQIAKNESLSHQFKLDTTLLLPMSGVNESRLHKIRANRGFV